MLIIQLGNDPQQINTQYRHCFYLLNGTTSFVKGLNWEGNTMVHKNVWRDKNQFLAAVKKQITTFRLELRK